MIIPGNSTREIKERASKRLVTAMIYMVAPPDAERPTPPEGMGMIVKDKKPALSLTANNEFVQGVHLWQAEDRCVTKLEKDPLILESTIEKIKTRRKRVQAGEFSDSDTQLITFNSEDIVSEAIGIKSQFHVDFDVSVKAGVPETFEVVPFQGLRNYLLLLQSKLNEIEGRVLQADVAHSPAMTAFDYYAQDFNKVQGIGRRYVYGDSMLSKGHNMLASIGMPLIVPPRKSLN